MDAFIVSGFMIVLTMLIMMARSNIRRWLGYANFVDIGFTVIMMYLFHGTFAGIVSASFAGVFMGAMLWVLKGTLGYERLTLVRTKWYRGCVTLKWIYNPPRWQHA